MAHKLVLKKVQNVYKSQQKAFFQFSSKFPYLIFIIDFLSNNLKIYILLINSILLDNYSLSFLLVISS